MLLPSGLSFIGKSQIRVFLTCRMSQSAQERNFIVNSDNKRISLDKNTATVRMRVLNVEGFIVYLGQGNHGVQWIYSER